MEEKDENSNFLDVTVGSILGESFSALPCDASTPHSKRLVKKPNSLDARNLFKVPLVPQPSKKTQSAAVSKILKRAQQKAKEKLGCRVCGKEYVNVHYYKNHVRAHAIEEAAARYPDREKILANLHDITRSTLEQIKNSPPYDEVSEYATIYIENIGKVGSFEEFAEAICNYILRFIIDKKFLLPSKLLESLVKGCEALLCDLDFRDEMVLLLSLCRDASDENVLNFFIHEFVLCFSEKVLKFISISIREDGRFIVKPKYECDDYDRQTLHYIGGALLRGFYKRAKLFPNNIVWKSIKDTIVQKMIENENTESASPDDKSWTDSRDRGSLIKICADCFEFIVLLAEIIADSEEADGSISYLSVYDKVCRSVAMSVYWDRMISDSLSENVSILFMRALVKACCQTYGRGISKRRLNTANDVPVASITLRHQVARKVKV